MARGSARPETFAPRQASLVTFISTTLSPTHRVPSCINDPLPGLMETNICDSPGVAERYTGGTIRGMSWRNVAPGLRPRLYIGVNRRVNRARPCWRHLAHYIEDV
jgi:hypothetical protein